MLSNPELFSIVLLMKFKKFLSLKIRILKMKINLPDKLYYSIGEVAKAFDVNTSLIRYWEQEFPIIKPKKNKKGNRYFTPEDIKNLQIIYHLVKEKGYTLDGAKIALTTNSKISETITLIDRLEFVKAELLKLKDSLVEKDSE
ncbi:DNA-binding transcriptional MerR regulator [Chryseobacterium sp. SLBN-27]|jgi:DNA-binding transcriptional MerR regulator|nr:DNA-binding transcriptional MerR regulator [Chryseobacterium sp. SLBN-27]